MPKQQDSKVPAQIKRLANWIRLLSFLYRILIVLGLILLFLVILLLMISSRFSLWIILVPGFLIGSGIFIAWIEYQLHERHYQLADEYSADRNEEAKL